MEGHPAGQPTQETAWPRAGEAAGEGRDCRPRRDRLLVAVLLCVAAGVQGWLLSHTEVAARDSIGYIRAAVQIRRGTWRDSLSKAEQHPGYPLAIAGVSSLLDRVQTGPESVRLQQAAQLTSALAGVLLVVPMFLLGRELFDRRVGFWTALLLQVLPPSGRVLADGLSEPLFLLLAAMAFYYAAVGLRRQRAAPFALAGVWGGLAYLRRPDGAFIVAAAGVVLLAVWVRGFWLRSRREFLACGLALAAGGLATGGPLVAVTGKITIKNTPRLILQETFGQAASVAPGVGSRVGTRRVPLASWWGEGDGGRRLWGVKALAAQFGQATQYVLWLPMVLGLWWFPPRLGSSAGAWVVLLVGLAVGACLYRVASGMGYLSDRHTLLIVMGLLYWAVAALLVVGEALGAALVRWVRARRPGLATWKGGSPAARGGVFVGVLALAILPRTLEPLHGNRAGFRNGGGFDACLSCVRAHRVRCPK
jgi:4-amino-4-deoxy-L-arabinose transferase-like glycosyltransferase